MPPNILIVNTGFKEAVAHVRDELPDAHVDVIVEPAYAPLHGEGATVHVVDAIGDLSALREVVLGLMRERRIDRIVAPSERSMLPGGYLRSVLGFPGIGFDLANRFSNKAVMKRTLSARKVQVADFRPVASLSDVAAAAEEIGWPVVLKPAFGAGAMHTFCLGSHRELRELAESPSAAKLAAATCLLMVEKYIDMDGEYHCNGIVQKGEVTFASVSRYREPVLRMMTGKSGVSLSLPDSHPDVAPILDLHRRAVTALGLDDGVTHLEIFKTATGFLVGEIACRPGGGHIPVHVLLQSGVDLVRAFFASELGQPVAEIPGRSPRETVVVSAHLPERSGRVTRVSAAEELTGIDGVLSASVSARVGDHIGSYVHSTTATGEVHFEVDSADQADDKLGEIMSRYVLEVE
jgi:hypothetical protein